MKEAKKLYINIDFNPEWISGFLYRDNDYFRSFKAVLTSDVHNAIEGISPYLVLVVVTKWWLEGDSRCPWICKVTAGPEGVRMPKGACARALHKAAIEATKKTLSRWR